MTDLLALARELHSIAQAGLTYGTGPYDLARYARLREIAADLLAGRVDGDGTTVRAAMLAEDGYLTPKVDIRAAVRARDARLLLVHERTDAGWTMPGGWADVGESVGEGAVREVAEEAGVAARAVGLLGLYERERRGHPPLAWHCLKVVVACEPATDDSGDPVADGLEVDAADWFTPAQARALTLSTGRTSPWLLERVLTRFAEPLVEGAVVADLD